MDLSFKYLDESISSKMIFTKQIKTNNFPSSWSLLRALSSSIFSKVKMVQSIGYPTSYEVCEFSLSQNVFRNSQFLLYGYTADLG